MRPLPLAATLLLAATWHATAEPSREIDALVAAGLTANGIEPNAPSSDAEFLRRTYLGIAGRIPTADESRAFLDSPSPDKRAKLVDILLASDGFVSHQFNYWADILRAQTRLQGIRGNAGDPYIRYLKDSLRANKPYDDLVRELVTASGDTWDPADGASGFYRRDKGMPLDHMALTVQVFLGTQLSCAQCHDHPFDDWTQKDFFQMAAFTNLPSTQPRNGRPVALNDRSAELRRVQAHLRRKSAGGTNTASRALGQIIRSTLGFGIPDAGTGTIRLPKDYQYEDDDAKPGEVLQAKTLFGNTVPFDPAWNSRRRDTGSPDSRDAFAEWMVSPENPRFTKVIVNRLWKRAMGRGLVEPVDDFRENTKPSNPELLAYLEKLMADLDYDMKAFLRVLYRSETYQRKAHTDDLDPAVAYHFQGPLLQRMTAEQMWDSLLTLKLEDVDAYKNPHDTGVQYAAYAKLDAMETPEMIAFIDEFLGELEGGRGNPAQVYTAFARKMGAGEAYEEMGGGQGMRAMAGAEGLTPEQLEVFRDRGPELRRLMEEGRRAREDGDRARARRIFARAQGIRTEIGLDPAAMRRLQQGGGNGRGRRGGGPGFVRASEMVSPAPGGHFLREFGSADREAVENASLEATTPQALEFLNGVVDQALLSDANSRILKGLDAAGDAPEKKLEFLYLAIWNRYPSPKETAFLTGFIRDTKDGNAYHDIIWSMLNSHEFRFIQ